MIALRVGERAVVTLPWSEVCLSMGVAGKAMWAELLPDAMVQLYGEGGGKFSFPITAGEAGVRPLCHVCGVEEWHVPDGELCRELRGE